MMQIVNQLNGLKLEKLDEDWVKAIYHSEFLEIPDFPSEYEAEIENVNSSTVFNNIIASVDEWLSDNSNVEEKSWAELSHRVQHEQLLTVIAYHINHGTKNVQTKEYRNNSLLASRVYYKLLSIPGYKAYHIYHAQLFTHSLACLNYPKEICDKEENYFNTKELTREVNSIIRELRHYVLDLKSVFEKLHLKPDDMNFEDILSNLVDIIGGAIVNKLNIDKIELSNISGSIYVVIDNLLHDGQGEPNADAILLLFKCLLPKLVAAAADYRNANNLVRASYVTYCGILLTRYGKAAVSGFNILLQHICYDVEGLERAEVRASRVSMIVGLMSLLPKKSYKNTVKWLLTLTTTARVTHRHIAMEILAKLLTNDPDETPEPKQQNQTDSPNQMPQENAGEGVEVVPQESTEKGESEVGASAAPAEQEVASVCTEDESSQELPEADPEELSTLLCARRQQVPHAAVVRALVARAVDVSSTLRARALQLLADCLAHQHPPLRAALQELSGADALAAVAESSARDERAAVRRAALLLLHRLMLADPAHLTAENLEVVVRVCRDASVLVRGAGVCALGELAAAGGDLALDAFLRGAMLQLNDPETKIQEQVVSLVQTILIDPLQQYSAAGDPDPLPWRFLREVVRNNMRQHLQKACAILAKSAKCINHRVVDILSTHLGVRGREQSDENSDKLSDERDLQCLVLLTSLAADVDYTELDFVLQYYYALTADEKERDCRLLPLAAELLSEWARWLTAEQRVTLRAHLIEFIRKGCPMQEDGRIPCAMLASQLNPGNVHWATDLMQLYERKAMSGESESGGAQWCVCAADLALVSPAPPSPAFLRHLLHVVEQNQDDSGVETAESGDSGAVVAALGRVCVKWRAAAAAAAPPLAALLDDQQRPLAARHNALLALADICTRFTCIVEPLLGSVCGCVSRGCAGPLRRAAAAALTRLLLAGFLRLRTPLYYRYCALLADEDAGVREPAEYYVTTCLAPDTIYHHFVDCVLHYNTDAEDISFDSRQLIYDVMLQRLSLVQKLNVQCRLAREVLAGAADRCDDGDALPDCLHAALLDAITLLCGPRMRLPRKPDKAGDAADIDDLQERVTTNIVSHKMKRTVAEVLVPAVLRLYAHLRPRGGQLAVYLVRIATDLLKDYRQEIEELIENDEELVGRISQFQETIGEQPSFGNARNLVTTSAAPDPETPRRRPARTPRRRPAPSPRHTPAKRALRI